jgi:hypothetical protein
MEALINHLQVHWILRRNASEWPFKQQAKYKVVYKVVGETPIRTFGVGGQDYEGEQTSTAQ